jgi:hypothetical protein
MEIDSRVLPPEYSIWEKLVTKSHNDYKALSSIGNLAYLDTLINGNFGRLLCDIFNSKRIFKIKPNCVGKKFVDGYHDYYEYGHIKIDNNSIRLSTCLDRKNGTVQYPIEEQQYFERGTFLFFTCGDLYLLVDVLKLKDQPIDYRRETKNRNYEISISNLFLMGVVSKFGLIDGEEYEDIAGLHKLQTVLPKRFLQRKLRGCITGRKPKYVLARIENTDVDSYFEYELRTTIKDVWLDYGRKNGLKSWNAISIQCKKNTEALFNDSALIKPAIIKKKEGVSFLIFDYTKCSDLERIRNHCIKVRQKFFEKQIIERDYGLQQTIRRCFFVRSTEEYTYYKGFFLKSIEKKARYSNSDIDYIKTLIKPSIKAYIPSKDDHFYEN